MHKQRVQQQQKSPIIGIHNYNCKQITWVLQWIIFFRFYINHLAFSPTITQDVKKEIRGIPGQNVYIHCEALGHKPLQFQWFKKRELLQGETGNKLELKSVSESDGGYYTCRIANCHGCIFTSWAKLIIDEDSGAHSSSPFGK